MNSNVSGSGGEEAEAEVKKLVRATLIMFREFNTLELTFCVEFLIILLRETLTNSLTLMTLMIPMTQAW